MDITGDIVFYGNNGLSIQVEGNSSKSLVVRGTTIISTNPGSNVVLKNDSCGTSVTNKVVALSVL